MSVNQDENPQGAKGSFSIYSKLEVADKLFYGLVTVSFFILVILAFLEKSAGMTVLGAFTGISMAFLKLEKFSEFSGLGFSGKLKDAIEKVNAIAERETEMDPEESADTFGEFAVFQVSPQEKRALDAIYRSNFTFRSVAGISEQLKVSQTTASRLLNNLLQKGLVSHNVTSKRRSVWSITEKGIAYLQRSSGKEEQES